MRPLILLSALAACAQPQLDVPQSPQIARADYPALLPFDQVLDQRVDTSAVSPEATASLEARAARTRSRRLGSVDTGTLANRADALRNRAAAIRAGGDGGDESEAIRERAARLRGQVADD